MYKDFFHLERNPFDLTPDPRCFVPTPRHYEALSTLYYGVRSHKGFVVVSGEVGTGKTLLLRCLLGILNNSSDILCAYVFNSRLTPTDLLQYILSDFGLQASGKNRCELLVDLSKFVIERGALGMTTALIVDEAHDLSSDSMEELRLLSNLETAEDKLLQIVLAGQPELDEKLDCIEHRQLKQRIALRTRLDALTECQTQEYIEQRLRIAGADANATPILSQDAIAALYTHSRGIPRLINTICDNALISAYAKQIPTVTEAIVEEVAKELRVEPCLDATGKAK